jgi:hypothetical protein
MTADVLDVSRRSLLIILSSFWGIGALLLCLRSAQWMNELTGMEATTRSVLIVVLAGVFYRFVLSAVVARAVERVRHLPARVSVFRAFSARSVLLLATMVSLGVTLRLLDVPPTILLYPYATMGIALLTGALQLLRASRVSHNPETS